MNFKPFHMGVFSREHVSSGTINLHSSNPEPFDWYELQSLIDTDLGQLLTQSDFHYESTQGTENVRSLLVEHQYKGLSNEDVVLTSGAQEGIFIVINSLLQTGDEVITFTPCFEPLVTVANAAGAHVHKIPLNPEHGWSIPWRLLEKKISSQTKMIIINFPHNPTGASITQQELKKLVALCEHNDCWLFADEVFRGLEHQNKTLPAVATLYDKGISMGVMSKSLALPGIRVGWLVNKKAQLRSDWLNIKSYLSICQSGLDAKLTESVLPHTQKILQRNLQIIGYNKKIMLGCLADHPDFTFSQPKASATAFVQLKNETNAEDFCIITLSNHNIYLMPNTAFLTDDAGFRITLGKRSAATYYQTLFS